MSILYQWFTIDNYLLLEKQCSHDHTISFTCNTCLDRVSLMYRIDDLNQTIIKLNERITSLQTIRGLENDIDFSFNENALNKTMYGLADQFANLTVADGISPPGNNVTIPVINTFSTNNTDNDKSCITSVWDSESDSVSQIQYSTHLLDNSILEEEQESNDKTENLHQNERMDISEFSKFQINKVVKTIFIGDKTIQNIDIHTEKENKNDIFKIAKPNSTIDELIDTIDFFLKKLHKGVNQVVLQIGLKDMKIANSEEIKENILAFTDKMNGINVNVLLSGPVPHPNISSTTFSRMVAINVWLQKHVFPENVRIVDNMQTFTNINKFYNSNDHLSIAGNTALRTNILQSLSD